MLEECNLSKNILFFLHVYQSFILVLPKCIQKDDHQVKRFLWNGFDEHNMRAKVEWGEVCKPKNGGGLGILDFRDWNEGMQLKHIQTLSTGNEDSLG